MVMLDEELKKFDLLRRKKANDSPNLCGWHCIWRNVKQMIKYFVQQIQSEFKISLEWELTYFLGFQVKQMTDDLFVSQSKYAKNIVKMFCLENAMHKRTYVATHVKLIKDDQGVTIDESLYKSMIGSLLYLTLIVLTSPSL